MTSARLRENAPDIRMIIRGGRWVFVLLLTWGLLVTGGLYYRASQKVTAAEPELYFRMRGMSETEEALYADYFAQLKTSDLRAKTVQFGRSGTAVVKVDVDLSGMDDPRLRQVLDGLSTVRETALRRLMRVQQSLEAQIAVLEKVIGGSSPDSAADTMLADLQRRKALYDQRIANPRLPELVEIKGAGQFRNLATGVIGCFLAAVFTALAGGFVFGYGRMLQRNAAPD